MSLFTASDSWQGKWFPNVPADEPSTDLFTTTPKTTTTTTTTTTTSTTPQPTIDNNNRPRMGIANFDCDDGQTRLTIDFDETNVSHQLWYKCLSSNRTEYQPQRKRAPVMIVHTIPPMYSALHRCTNETIQYDDRLPTL